MVNTNTSVVVILVARAMCPKCRKTIELRSELDELSLSTGNTTQQASYSAKSLRSDVDARKRECLWNDEMCGSCRVSAAEGG